MRRAEGAATKEEKVSGVAAMRRAGSDVSDKLHASMLRYFPELVTELGGDPLPLLQQAGIAPEALAEDAPDLRYRQAVPLLEMAAAVLACPDFGMRLAMRQGGCDVFGPLGQVMKNSRTFGEALVYVATHNFAHSLAARIWLRSCRPERAVFSGHDILLDRLPNKAQLVEQILLVGSLGAMELTGGHVRARKVHFRHQPVSAPEIYRRYFRCEVLFDQNEDGVVYSERDMACPIVNPDPESYRAATSYIDTEFTQQLPPLAVQVRGLVIQFLATSHCTNTGIAAKLGVHPRSLHRHLTAEGVTFQQIKDEVRRDAMQYLIQHTDLEFSRISEKLGFAEPSVLTRWCNRWLDASPTKLRLQARNFAHP
jgi:AraC-like DNA-binding protein